MDPITLGILAIAGVAAYRRYASGSSEEQPIDEVSPVPRPNARIPTYDRARKEACKAANEYVSQLRARGLPVPDAWDSQSCDAKIALVASIASGGAPIPVAIAGYLALKSGAGKIGYNNAVGAAKSATNAAEANFKGAKDFAGKIRF